MTAHSKSATHQAELATRDETAQFGFWVYLLSDVMIFGALFATFMILRHNTAGGPSAEEIFEPHYVLMQTMLLLASSFTCAVALLAARHEKLREMRYYLLATLALGAMFLLLELVEFYKLSAEGITWQTSAFLSSWFALVGTHGLHILIGLTWLATLLVHIRKARTLSPHMLRRLGLFGLFWHFLDLVWIAIFTIVYMFGVGGV